MRVVTDSMPHLETVSLGVWVDVGARHEPVDLHGVSHMLEHMAFKGTARRSAREIAEAVENVGGQMNAYTSRECTAYYVQLLKNDVPLAVDILSDILLNSVFDDAELQREKAVIIQEIGQAHDTPDDLVFDMLQEVSYPEQALGRSILGTADAVEAIGRGGLRDYMASHYSADKMVLAAAGGVEHDQIVALAEQAFAALSSGKTKSGSVDTGVGAVRGANFAGGDRRAMRDLEQVHIAFALDGVTYDDPDYIAAQVSSAVLGGGMSSRLFQEVREKRGLVYSIFSFASSYRDGGQFGVYAGTGSDQVAELIPVVAGEMGGLAGRAVPDEVARAKAQLKAGTLISLESSSSRCEQIARQILVYGRVLTIEELVERIDEVDEARVEKVTARVLGSSPPALAAIGPLAALPDYDFIADRFSYRV